jgi:hypothetical protein
MPLTLTKVHEWQRVPNTTEVRLVSERNYIRLMDKDAGYPLFIQSGQVFSEDGEAVGDLPEWFWVELRKCNPVALAAVGYVGPMEPPEVMHRPTAPIPVRKPKAAPVGKPWTCEACGRKMTTRQMSLHKVWHRHQAKKIAESLGE